MAKDLPANARDVRDSVSIPELRRFPGGGHGNPLQCSCLENPMDRGAWRDTVTIRNSGLQVGASKLSLHGRRHRWFYRIDFQVFEINSTVYLSETLTDEQILSFSRTPLTHPNHTRACFPGHQTERKMGTTSAGAQAANNYKDKLNVVV